jgi:prepilin-type N-terminal cleavage/methylation domain-containing protein
MMTPSRGQRLLGGKAFSKGFSLLELLVAMAVFLVVGAAAFTLFSRHQALLRQEQGIVGLNIGLRNALAQVQLDAVNAGNGLILGTNVPAWPVGVTIYNSNPTTTQCNPTASNPPVYVDACFDKLNVILADPNTPAIHPQNSSGLSISTSSGTTLYGAVPSVINPATGNLFTAAQLAAKYNRGDQVLFVQSCSGGSLAYNSSGCKFTTAILTAAGTPSTTTPPGPNFVSLAFNSTLTPGPPGPPPSLPYAGSNNASNDPLGMTTNAAAGQLTDSFGPNDWVVRLSPITYSVNTNDPTDPQLIRTQAGTQNVLMDQVVAFKVGAAWWNNPNTSTYQYEYNSNNYSNDFALIRSVRVSLIGRSRADPTNPYRNPFDSGPYQIRGSSIIVDPRNLTMNSH